MRPKSGRADLGFAHRIGQAAKTGAADLKKGTPKMLATCRRSGFSTSRQSRMLNETARDASPLPCEEKVKRARG